MTILLLFVWTTRLFNAMSCTLEVYIPPTALAPILYGKFVPSVVRCEGTRFRLFRRMALRTILLMLLGPMLVWPSVLPIVNLLRLEVEKSSSVLVNPLKGASILSRTMAPFTKNCLSASPTQNASTTNPKKKLGSRSSLGRSQTPAKAYRSIECLSEKIVKLKDPSFY